MMFDGIIDKPIHFRDFVSLRGARLDSELLIDEVVRAYRAGRMERYNKKVNVYFESERFIRLCNSLERTLQPQRGWVF